VLLWETHILQSISITHTGRHKKFSFLSDNSE
jgi:hypothetical protein